MKIESVTIGCKIEASIPARKFVMCGDMLELSDVDTIKTFNSRPVAIIASDTSIGGKKVMFYIQGYITDANDAAPEDRPFNVTHVSRSVPEHSTITSHSIMGCSMSQVAHRDNLIFAGFMQDDLGDTDRITVARGAYGSPIHNIPSGMTASIRRVVTEAYNNTNGSDASLENKPKYAIVGLRLGAPDHALRWLEHGEGTLGSALEQLGGWEGITKYAAPTKRPEGEVGDWNTVEGNLASLAANIICSYMQYRNMTNIHLVQDLTESRSHLRVKKADSAVGNFRGETNTILYKMLRQPLRGLRRREFADVTLEFTMNDLSGSYITVVKGYKRYVFEIPSGMYSRWCPMYESSDDLWSLGRSLVGLAEEKYKMYNT